MMTNLLGGGHSLPLLYRNNSNKQLRPQNKLYIKHPVIQLSAAKNRVLPLITNNSPSVQEKGNATMKNFLHLVLRASGYIAFKNEFHMHLKAINPINIFLVFLVFGWVSLPLDPVAMSATFWNASRNPPMAASVALKLKSANCLLNTEGRLYNLFIIWQLGF